MPFVVDESEPSIFSFERQLPYMLATVYVLLVSGLILYFFPVPPPRFMDMYLIGMVFFAVRWSTGPALAIYVLSIFFSGWILPPKNSLTVSEGYDVYRMCSYSATSGAVLWATRYLRSRR